MGLWSSLFGKKEKPSPEQEHVRLFSEFTNESLRSWNDAERYVQSHPEILQDEALGTMAGFVVALGKADLSVVQHGGANMKEQFTTRVALLIRCREVGVARAFDEIRMSPATR